MRLTILVVLISLFSLCLSYENIEEPLQPYENNIFPPAADFPSDFITFPIAKNTSAKPIYEHTELKIKFPYRKDTITGHVFVIKNPKNLYAVFPSPKGCPGKEKTSNTAKLHNCELAMNAGFFGVSNGQCIGHVISRGKIIQNDPRKNPTFGIREDGSYIIGYLNKTDVTKAPQIRELVAGVIWLIRDRKEYVNKSRAFEGVSQSFINLKAPRVAIGHNSKGELVMFHTNGYFSDEPGVDLYEVVQIMSKFDIVNAVNLDGGGSSTVVLNGKIINRCSDKCSTKFQKPFYTRNMILDAKCPNAPERCERKVTTISCILSKP